MVVNDNVTFQGEESGNMWYPVVKKGNQFEFNESVWGVLTRRYLDPIAALSEDQFMVIVNDTQEYVKKGKQSTSALAPMEDDEFEDLFSFR